MSLKVNNPFKLGMYQAHKYFSFLFPHLTEDVEQVVRMAIIIWEKDPSRDIRLFNNTINRELYKLSNEYGYHKTKKNQTRKWYQFVNTNFPRTDKEMYILRGKI